uniref:rat RAP n=1 Tax=Rattus norvegicus TaxID=10116 RepID=UPI0032E9394A
GPLGSHGGKYSREKNEPEMAAKRESGEEFRMEKLNQLWEKAKRLHLSPVRLAELHSDLKIQERDELNWKKLKVEGLDGDGEKEAKLVHNLNVILARYGLDGRKDTQTVHSNALNEDTQDELGDPRLEKLWHKAKTSGKFSSEELDKLWREFLHYKEKIHEYNVLLDTLSRAEEGYENLLSPSDMTHIKSDTLASKHSELKGRKDTQTVHSNALNEDTQDELGDPRLEKLWHKAKTSGKFSSEELDKLWREFLHYKEKIHEYNVLLDTLSRAEEGYENLLSPSDMTHIKSDTLASKHSELKLLEEKTKELGYKVKKHLQDLSSRVSRARHNEL